jgi:hypothetical protein
MDHPVHSLSTPTPCCGAKSFRGSSADFEAVHSAVLFSVFSRPFILLHNLVIITVVVVLLLLLLLNIKRHVKLRL